MSETARRIRILYELDLADGFRYDELMNRYGIKNMLDVRLERLMSMKQITEYNGYLVLKSFLLYRIGIIVLNWGLFLKYNNFLSDETN